MANYVQRVDSWLSDKNFPIYLLAFAGFLSVPPWAVVALAVGAFFYSLFQRQQSLLHDKELWKHPIIQRFAVVSMLYGLWVIGAGNDLLVMTRPGSYSAGCLLLVIFITYMLAFLYSYSNFPFVSSRRNSFRALEQSTISSGDDVATVSSGHAAAISGESFDGTFGENIATAACEQTATAAGELFATESGELKGTKYGASFDKLQDWTNRSMAAFQLAFVYAVFGSVFFFRGIGQSLSNWLIASANDANFSMESFEPTNVLFQVGRHLYPLSIAPQPAQQFTDLVSFIVAGSITLLLWRMSVRLSMLCTDWIIRARSKQTVHDALLAALRARKERLQMRVVNPFFHNACASFLWLCFCYAVLFAIFGLSGGPLGKEICGWFDCSIIPTRHDLVYGASQNPNLRYFCAAIVALYGTVPLAISGAVFLPFFRRAEIRVTQQGLFVPDASYVTMGFRPFRLWTDISAIYLCRRGRRSRKGLCDSKRYESDTGFGASTLDELADKNSKIIVSFHSGGKVELKVGQLSTSDLDNFLSLVDENATNCLVSDEVADLRNALRRNSSRTTDQCNLKDVQAEHFQSTVFVPFEPGAQLPESRARVVKMLASRPLSSVYLVRLPSGKLAIAKQIYLADDSPETDAYRKCFEREHELLKSLEHDSICKVLEVFHDEQSSYLLLEYASGTDLRTLITDEGPVSEQTAYDWALELCEIMFYLHAQDPPILHRDLTPDNVVLCPDGRLKIIDFGAAHQFLEGLSGTVLGKQAYVSPEQLQGTAEPKSDIYSFGGLLYFVLTGKEPIALTQSNPSVFADVTPQLVDVVKRCTEYDALLRPQSFAALKDELIAARNAPVQAVIEKWKRLLQPASDVPVSDNSHETPSLKDRPCNDHFSEPSDSTERSSSDEVPISTCTEALNPDVPLPASEFEIASDAAPDCDSKISIATGNPQELELVSVNQFSEKCLLKSKNEAGGS